MLDWINHDRVWGCHYAREGTTDPNVQGCGQATNLDASINPPFFLMTAAASQGAISGRWTLGQIVAADLVGPSCRWSAGCLWTVLSAMLVECATSALWQHLHLRGAVDITPRAARRPARRWCRVVGDILVDRGCCCRIGSVRTFWWRVDGAMRIWSVAGDCPKLPPLISFWT